MNKIVLIIMICLGGIGTMQSQTRAERKQQKEEKANIDYSAAKTLIESGTYSFEAIWANPSGGTRFSLIGNPNYLRVDNNNAAGFFPYFGVLHSLTNYGRTSAGIEFDSSIENYKVDFNDKKRKITVKFRSRNKSEWFDVIVKVYANSSAFVSITGSNRNNMSYDGQITKLEEINN
ncbi:DUF4251 domain-containing protein [Aquimarina sp. 2201CG14-23]|uniref:DUF4251 domain-containing protein n=1 Tax=Aquimarina mycalae TaxID=3040073 RepID=UPI002477D1CC|nr:DUF4251 domain-containing protein [Aquimarina sp. 2201CG14-23]MDH7445549.1 DUF4251 domain-containing protein [Aquimarina sp. 2201CG14-23]